MASSPTISHSPNYHHITPTILLLQLLLITTFPFPSQSSDPDALQDFCIADLTAPFSLNGYPCKPELNTTSDDFFFHGLSQEGDTSNSPFKSHVTQGNVLTFPGLNTLGISMNRVDLAPDKGLNPPHWHPRATESGVVVRGKVLVGLVSTKNVYYSKVLGPGDVFVVPKGLAHFQMNVGEGKALMFVAFNSHLPGSASVASNMFGSSPSVPDDVLTRSFQVEGSVVDEIKSKFGG